MSAQTEHYSEYKGNKQLKLNFLNGKNGMYFTVDTFKPTAKKEEPVVAQSASDLPF